LADDRRRRFSQIERPRGAAEPPDAAPGTGTRFGALEEPAPPAPEAAPPPPAPSADPLGEPSGAPVARGHTDRFRPAAERPLEVDDRAEASQPFVRCARCETDSSRYAARCSTCGEPLDTDEQRAFNARLWAERRAIADAEAGARAEREASLEQARQEEAVARRALAEDLAREVGQRERRRLDGDVFGEPTFGPPPGGLGGPGDPSGWGGGLGGGERWGSGGLLGPGTPIGFRLLSALPRGWGVAAAVGAVALAAGLYLVRPAAGLVVAVVVVSLFTPSRWRWRRRRW
jgi:hypothetical protein